jgi:hypothetical protein
LGIANCWGFVQGLDLIARHYLLGQLDRAVAYWRVINLLDQAPLPGQTKQAKKREEQLWRAVEVLAYRIVVQADGWRMFCRQLQIDAELPLRDLTGHESVLQVEMVARQLACTYEEACVRLCEAIARDKSLQDFGQQDSKTFRVDTTDDVAQSMLILLEAQLTTWS